MGKRGPRPTPTAILKARGSKVAAYERNHEPPTDTASPPMPSGMPREAQEHWTFIVPQLVTRRTLTAADLGLLAGMCRWWARYVKAARAVDALERSGKKFKGHQMDHPRLRERSAWQEYVKAALEFGLSPSAKSKVVAAPRDEKIDEREKIFSGPRLAQ